MARRYDRWSAAEASIAREMREYAEERQLAADLAGLDLSPEALYAPDWSAVTALRGELLDG